MWRSVDKGFTWIQVTTAPWSSRGGHSAVALDNSTVVIMGGGSNGGK